MPWEISKDGTTMKYRPIPFALREEEGARFPSVSCSQCGREFGPGDHGYSHCDDHPGWKRDQRLKREALIRAAVKNAALEQFPGTVILLGVGGALAWHSGFVPGRTFRNAIRRHFFALLEATNG